MDPREVFADQRFAAFCVYCGKQPSTADHVPSKVLLDEPYPENLPVVQACEACNNSFSTDEPYLACLVECALTGSLDANSVRRAKIKRILMEKPALASLIESCRHQDQSGSVLWDADVGRVRNVVLKLARGHVAYECSEPQLHEPERVSFAPICALSAEQLRSFETPPVETIWPEIGSRAFLHAAVVRPQVALHDAWHLVQPGRYRYLVSHSGPTVVRFVLSEYLACEVVWFREGSARDQTRR